MANVKNNAAAQETKRRLIEAAGAVFAEHGFERATIKEITDRADASIAAVNYHFSDKQELYYQAVQTAHQGGIAAIRTIIEGSATDDPVSRLHRFVHTLLKQALDPNRPDWHAALMSREMRDPTATCDRFIAEYFEPFIAAFTVIVAQIAGDPPPSPKVTKLFVDGLFGQCMHYVHGQCKHARMFPDDPPLSEQVDELADHITRFTVAGIRGMRPFKKTAKTER